jgi:hypothetical protein
MTQSLNIVRADHTLSSALSEKLPAAWRKSARVQKLFDEYGNAFDSVFGVDEATRELRVVKPRLREVLARFFPEQARDMLAVLEEAEPARFAEPESLLKPVHWQELPRYVKPVNWPDLGGEQPQALTTQELQRFVAKHVSGPLPPDLLEPEALGKYFARAASPATGAAVARKKRRGAVGCLYDRLGFVGTIAALALMALVGVAVAAAIAATGGVGATFWPAFMSIALEMGLMGAGAGMLTIIASCILANS